jgi:hypothetical protein
VRKNSNAIDNVTWAVANTATLYSCGYLCCLYISCVTDATVCIWLARRASPRITSFIIAKEFFFFFSLCASKLTSHENVSRKNHAQTMIRCILSQYYFMHDITWTLCFSLDAIDNRWCGKLEGCSQRTMRVPLFWRASYNRMERRDGCKVASYWHRRVASYCNLKTVIRRFSIRSEKW